MSSELIREQVIGPWRTLVSEQVATVPLTVITTLLAILRQWQGAFTCEDNFAQKNFGVPSLLVRIDCAPALDGGVGIYEVEERPSGVGVTREINPDFRERLGAWLKGAPDFKVLVSPRRGSPGTDDFLWAELAESGYDGPLLIRAEPEETEFHHLAQRSISSLLTKGDKSYGRQLGWWKEVGYEYFMYGLPWDKGFCLKPKQSSKCRGVHIFPPASYGEAPGRSHRKQIRSALNKARLYLQPWVAPGSAVCGGEEYLVLWRIFFGYDVAKKDWRPLGGHWIGRKNLRLHGATDAVHAPLLIG